MIDERKGGRSTQAAALGQNDEGITLPSIAPKVPDTPSRIVTLAPTWPPFSPAVLSVLPASILGSQPRPDTAGSNVV
jgi:hypothetical protein